MENSKLYSTHDIEKLKKKIATYRDTLTTLKNGNSIDDYLFMKGEFNGFKTKISDLEGELELMNEKQSTHLEEQELQVEKFSMQIDSLHQTVEELNQDISVLMDKLRKNDSDNSDLIEETNLQVGLQEVLNFDNNNVASEISLIKEETSQTNDQTPISTIQTNTLPPSYKQLKQFVNEAKNIEELPFSQTPSDRGAIQKKPLEEQQRFSKRNFPSNSIIPDQPYDGQYRKLSMKTTIHLNNVSKKHILPTNPNKNTTGFFQPTISEPENIETATETVEEYFGTTSYVAPIEKKEELIEIPKRSKQQESKSKESISFFKFFRKEN